MKRTEVKEEDMESDEIENVTSLDEISYTIADIISENGNAPVDLGKIGNRLNANIQILMCEIMDIQS